MRITRRRTLFGAGALALAGLGAGLGSAVSSRLFTITLTGFLTRHLLLHSLERLV